MPTELKDEMGKKIAEKGREVGTTTGRARRCGWLDLVVVGHSCRLNGVSKLAITKLDVLDGLEEIQVCTAYRHQGETLREFPASLAVLQNCQPIYETCKGWETVEHRVTMDELPQEAKSYLQFISDMMGVPIQLVSTGPGREETIAL
jgi:adenylosuccinate synthase